MKKILLFLPTLLLLFVPLSLSAVYYSFNHTCSAEDCIEGSKAVFSVNIRSDDSFVRYKSISIRELESNITIAVNNDLDLDVVPGQKVSDTLFGSIPPPTAGHTLIYRPCFKYIVLDSEKNALSPVIESCGSDTISMTVIPLSDISCYKTEDCEYYQYCHDFKCLLVECSECQYIKDHECIDYGCCRPSDCNENEACLEHECVELKCLDIETLENHACMMLDCAYDEKAENHECIELECLSDEKAENHECVKLDCAYNEKPQNNKCISLNCRNDEGYVNHECQKLRCGLFSNPKDHECIFNAGLLVRILGAMAVIAGVVGYLAYLKSQN